MFAGLRTPSPTGEVPLTLNVHGSMEAPAKLMPQLQQAKEESLRRLLKLKPSHKQYRRALNAYLEADYALQRATIERRGLEFHD